MKDLGDNIHSHLSDETIWKCLRAAGFDEEQIKRGDKGSLIAKLEAKIKMFSVWNRVLATSPDLGKWCKKGQSKSFNASTQTSGDLIAVGAHVGGGTIKVWNPKICLRLILMWEDRFCRGGVEEMDGCDD
ncbi:hypothetical protein L1987_72942 [Smallanthus sonchifolius]|uniref:Uncharacterized protein n=1 Tax=Smallanthus sonchifolius TaxID=185202 RepID=A0ACB9AXI2_9ASTR|nr:hypothetical protein L1987_72942 [Smallanthus sonchifolius]